MSKDGRLSRKTAKSKRKMKIAKEPESSIFNGDVDISRPAASHRRGYPAAHNRGRQCNNSVTGRLFRGNLLRYRYTDESGFFLGHCETRPILFGRLSSSDNLSAGVNSVCMESIGASRQPDHLLATILTRGLILLGALALGPNLVFAQEADVAAETPKVETEVPLEKATEKPSGKKTEAKTETAKAEKAPAAKKDETKKPAANPLKNLFRGIFGGAQAAGPDHSAESPKPRQCERAGQRRRGGPRPHRRPGSVRSHDGQIAPPGREPHPSRPRGR